MVQSFVLQLLVGQAQQQPSEVFLQGTGKHKPVKRPLKEFFYSLTVQTVQNSAHSSKLGKVKLHQRVAVATKCGLVPQESAACNSIRKDSNRKE